MIKKAGKWFVAVLAVITMPIWIFPVIFIFVFGGAVDAMYRLIFDEV